jgi:hypothetical protein
VPNLTYRYCKLSGADKHIDRTSYRLLGRIAFVHREFGFVATMTNDVVSSGLR